MAAVLFINQNFRNFANCVSPLTSKFAMSGELDDHILVRNYLFLQDLPAKRD